MNKETIYIEPNDDITDILSRLKSSDKKVIALVPPKKSSVLLSSVNIKLIARTAKSEKKAVVLVTADDSLTKLAMAANLPVAPSLKSRPILPDAAKSNEPNSSPKAQPAEAQEPSLVSSAKASAESFTDEPEASKLVEEIEEEEADAKHSDKPAGKSEDPEDSSLSEESESSDKKAKKKEKKQKLKSTSDNPVVAFIADHKIWFIIGAVVLVGIGAFLFWALTIAPFVSVSISVRTSSSNFSENVTFMLDPSKEDSSTGQFALHEEKLEKEQTVKFTATGRKDLGELASGSLSLTAYLFDAGSIVIPAGSAFTNNGLNYFTLSEITLSLPGRTIADLRNNCANFGDDFDLATTGCAVSAKVSIKAEKPGEDYNISSATRSDQWSSSVPNIYASTTEAIAGGTSKIVTVVNQSDVDLALEKLTGDTQSSGKSELLGRLSDTVLPIEASYKVTTTDPKVTPAVGEEVAEGVTPTVESKTTYTLFTVDMVRIEEFIKSKAKLEDNKRIYSVGSPFIEYFTENESGIYSAKLKTTYKTGPKISESEVLERLQGEKIGRIEPVLKDSFPGVGSVSIDKSYFWVSSVPSDPNKVKINLTVEE
ncbi:hypothetical protein IJH29_00475 [Candidatus Saccharibacteria bacterium]|nr:hypothetical protein [Candidatus Saccharibacteria bacterium]